MGLLKNPKHERFAQELAKGKSQLEAYRTAGYKPDDGAAARLSGDVRIRERVAELLERAAVRAEISIASITSRLISIAERAEEIEGASGLAVSRAALMDAAKLNGLIKDRHEHTGRNGGPIEYQKLSDDEVEARIRAHEAERAGSTAH